MNVTRQKSVPTRTVRISARVTSAEAESIARSAEGAGLSVSTFLRERALAPATGGADAEALRAIDLLLDTMHIRVDDAIGAVRATASKLERTGRRLPRDRHAPPGLAMTGVEDSD